MLVSSKQVFKLGLCPTFYSRLPVSFLPKLHQTLHHKGSDHFEGFVSTVMSIGSRGPFPNEVDSMASSEAAHYCLSCSISNAQC